jgi:hypothetical protein
LCGKGYKLTEIVSHWTIVLDAWGRKGSGRYAPRAKEKEWDEGTQTEWNKD